MCRGRFVCCVLGVYRSKPGAPGWNCTSLQHSAFGEMRRPMQANNWCCRTWRCSCRSGKHLAHLCLRFIARRTITQPSRHIWESLDSAPATAGARLQNTGLVQS
jgi:hypothetical protein